MKEVKSGSRIEFMEEIPREELVRLRVLEEKVKTLGRFLEMQSANEEAIRMIFDWPTEVPELPFEVEAREKEKKKIPMDSVTVCQMYKDGRTQKQIADMSGLSFDYVRRILKAAGLIGSASYD